MKPPTLNLINGIQIPQFGLGTWSLKGQSGIDAIKFALSIGYRHLDTAEFYQNHQEVGQAIKQSGVKREEVFITSKINPSHFASNTVKDACQTALKELATDYIDLYLIHWPTGDLNIPQAVKEMDNLRQAGLVKSIGVSNFSVSDLKLALSTSIEIANNQIEYHPYEIQNDIKKFCNQESITVTAYSPLAKGRALNESIFQDLAVKYDKPSSQVILNWILQKGMIAIPRSANNNHIKENLESLNWKLEPKDLDKIDNSL